MVACRTYWSKKPCTFHRVEVRSGETTSFWYDSWSSLGCLHEKLGERGCIDMGIPITSRLSEVMNQARRRKHRQTFLNLVEDELRKQREKQIVAETDIALLKGKKDCFHRQFIAKETWSLIRTIKPEMPGHKEIWFSNATPKYAFITWLVVKNKVATGERMVQWKQTADTSCVFCKDPMETREHLFFQCNYSKEIWGELMRGFLSDKYSETWQDIMQVLASKELDTTKNFILGYAFQNTIHAIWRERNDRRHGETPSTVKRIVKLIDKNIRNRLNTMRRGSREKSTSGIQTWFASRQHNS